MDLPKRPQLGFDPSLTPAPPCSGGNACITQDRCHRQGRCLGAFLDVEDLGINHDPDYMQDCTLLASTNAQSATRTLVQFGRMADAADDARDLMRRALEATGLTPYALAKRAGVAPSTLTRPLNDPDFKFTPKQATLNKIAAAAGLTPPTVADTSQELTPVSQWVPVLGEVRAGVWTEIPDEPLVEDRIAVHLPEYQRANLFALRVAGRSMDLKYVEGETVICAPAAEAGVRVGDDVVVRRCRGGLAETTLKEVVLEDDGSYSLCPRSSDPSFKPIPLLRGVDCQDGPEIIGVVVHSIVPRRKGHGPMMTL